MFQSARVKLTAWYLLIIMAISIFFSIAIYSRANFEFNRFERIQLRFQRDLEEGRIIQPSGSLSFNRPDSHVISDARTGFIISLGIINFAIFVLAGIAGYLLAGRTLRPIKKMVEEQNRFITDSSHELRTPLTSLRSEIEVGLRNKKLDSTTAKKLLKSNLEEVINLQLLTDGLLELAQNGNHKTQRVEQISLVGVVREGMRKLENAARLKKIKIDNKLKDIKIYGNKDRLIELFVILLDNAIKYSPTKSRITISSYILKDKVEILVSDNGMGIEEKDLPYIFDRFYRANKSRSKTQASGYGLGLSIAKKIVEAHRGTISVESKIKKGSIFKVVLPIYSKVILSILR